MNINDDKPNIKRIVQHFGAGVGKTEDGHLLHGVVPGMTTVIEHEGRGYAPRPVTTPPTFQKKKSPQRIPRMHTQWKVVATFPCRAVSTLTIYNNSLYAATTYPGMVYWKNGATWEESFDSGEEQLVSCQEYDGKLYAGTSPNGKVFVFDGSTWSLHATLDAEMVTSLKEYDGKLYAGCYPSGKIFVFDGTSWSLAYATGTRDGRCMDVYQNALFVGTYGQVGEPQGAIFVYDGTSWSLAYDTDRISINALGVYQDTLYVGGFGGPPGNILYTYDGSTWTTEEMTGISVSVVLAFTMHKNAFHAVGSGQVIRRKESGWRTIWTAPMSLYTLASYQRHLYAGGGKDSGTEATVFMQRRLMY